MEKETYQASENMKVFFEKLLDLKAFVKREMENMEKISKDSDSPNFNNYNFITLNRIFHELNSIIKEKQ